MTVVIETVRVYRSAGINVLPVRSDGSKAPAIQRWANLQHRPLTEDELTHFFNNGTVGIAAIGGEISGNLEVYDFDDVSTFEQWRELVVELLGEDFVQHLPIVQTPRPGRHVYTRCSDGVGGSQKLALVNISNPRSDEPNEPDEVTKTLIETKGEGGYVLLPGCPPECHETGRTYEVLQGDFAHIPNISTEQREILLTCGRSFNQIVRREHKPHAEGSIHEGKLSPGDDFNERGPNWADLLEPYGYRFRSKRGETSYWTRPGKDHGISASTNHGGSDKFYPFSTNCYPFDPNRAYSKFAAVAMLQFNGDYSATAHYLVRGGYGSHGRLRERNIFADILPSRAQQDAVTVNTAKADKDRYVSATPPESFVSRYVEYACQRTDAPLEAHELMAVGILSALAGPRPRLAIATNINGWTLVLWTLYIVNSTVGRKSSVIDYASDIVQAVLGPEAVLHWEGSPQGILQKLQKRDGQGAVFVRDEYSGLLAQINRGGHMAGLPQMFIRCYDCRPLENIRTKKKDKDTGKYEDDTDYVNAPYLVKLCASTWDSFISRATIDNVLDGFVARFIPLTGSSDPRQMQRNSPELDALRLALIQHAHTFHRKAQGLANVDIDDCVLELAFALEHEWTTKRASGCSRPDAAVPALKRLSESVVKVAALLAIDEAKEAQIARVRAVHFERAQVMGSRWIDSTIALIDALGRSEFQRDCAAVLSTIKEREHGIKLSELYRKHRRLKKRDFDQILEALKDQEEIVIPESEDKTKGRPALMIFFTGRHG